MKIENRLNALHALATLRRMEIANEDTTITGQRKYNEIYAACIAYFGENDPVFNAFENGHR